MNHATAHTFGQSRLEIVNMVLGLSVLKRYKTHWIPPLQREFQAAVRQSDKHFIWSILMP